ncbi:MAG: DnaJ C-terminal domain-containing protein [Myxococcota bacterium]
MAERTQSPYETLGVARDADADVLRKSYRKLAKKFHPDANPGNASAEERFKEISRAYDVLSDPEKRRAYDEFGDIALQAGFDAAAARRAQADFGQAFRGAHGADFDFGAAGGMEDLLGRMFGGAERGRGGFGRDLRGPDVEAELELDFMEAVHGGEKKITLAKTGPRGGAQSENVTIRIPRGVADGGRIRLAGRGGASPGGGPRGDLYATIRVRPHPVFRREGRDVLLDLPIAVSEAIRGAQVEVPTLDGRATVAIPPGSDSGRKLRLRGKGVPDPGGGARGDLYVVVQIRVPKQLGADALAHVDALAEHEAKDLREGLFRS